MLGGRLLGSECMLYYQMGHRVADNMLVVTHTIAAYAFPLSQSCIISDRFILNMFCSFLLLCTMHSKSYLSWSSFPISPISISCPMFQLSSAPFTEDFESLNHLYQVLVEYRICLLLAMPLLIKANI